MKYIHFITVLICGYSSFAQKEQDFISAYNNHIDPTHQLNTIKILNLKIELHAKGIINSTPVNVDNVNECQYSVGGASKCLDSENGRHVDLNLFPPVKDEFNNYLKAQLNFISIKGDSTFFRFKTVNDSITIIERRINARQKFVYTFDSKTINLLQIESNFEKSDTKYSSQTRFLAYDNVNSILVPKHITFTNNFCTATVIYSNFSFH